ncbi:hypothetical protein B0I33_101540 [Prauserella shujinwangii]|uniref:Uncharacterized protein n=1 Tax=Prauserella shujinwangii TaxID=1453103 RepID=A0A2T0M3T6_9PSEU|nr:hypothetical protein B0I33_101540 [Prauserella shujinwangii]
MADQPCHGGPAGEGEPAVRGFVAQIAAMVRDDSPADVVAGLASLPPPVDEEILGGAFGADNAMNMKHALAPGDEGWVADLVAWPAPWGIDVTAVLDALTKEIWPSHGSPDTVQPGDWDPPARVFPEPGERRDGSWLVTGRSVVNPSSPPSHVPGVRSELGGDPFVPAVRGHGVVRVVRDGEGTLFTGRSICGSPLECGDHRACGDVEVDPVELIQCGLKVVGRDQVQAGLSHRRPGVLVCQDGGE